jgi:hypothetical protein
MSAGEDGGKDLLDDVILTDDHALQLFLHQATMLGKFLQEIAETARFGGHAEVVSGQLSVIRSS